MPHNAMTSCKHIYDEYGRCFECDQPRLKVMNPNQVENTRRWRENQNKRGNRAVTVQCPVDRVEELKALVADWRNREQQNKEEK